MQDRSYKDIHNIFGNSQVAFMNHGFSPTSEDLSDVPFRHQASLYSEAVSKMDLSGKNILEIGCGRGGGSQWISKNNNISSYHACDISEESIDFCKKNNELENVFYSVMDSQNLNYEENSFDLIICIESSHGYKNMELFFENARRVLKETGQLVLLDNYVLGDIAVEKQLMSLESVKRSAQGFSVLEYKDITDNVKEACRQDINLIDDWVENVEISEMLKSISAGSLKRYENKKWGYFKFVFGTIEL